MKHLVAVSLVVLFVAAGSAMAERTVVINTTVQDTQCHSGAASGNADRGWAGRVDVTWDPDGPICTVQLQWDLSGVNLLPGESIESATLDLYAAAGGFWYTDAPIVAYPMKAEWWEGRGCTSSQGDTGWGYGGATAADVTRGAGELGAISWNYSDATSAGIDAGWSATRYVATGGVAWAAGGATDIGGDVLNRKMIDELATGGSSLGSTLFDTLNFTAEGCNVLAEWANGTLDNHGLNLWVTGGATDHMRIATRDHLASQGPTLNLTIVPEPATMGLLGLGTLGLAALRRRRRK